MSPVQTLESKIKVMEETVELMEYFLAEFNGDTKKVVFKIAADMLRERMFIIECQISRMKDVQYEGC
jgi:hypothetical protein